MNAGRTARERARAELIAQIKAAAGRQLATEGAQRLSLRAIARELGMVSSALYRYFPSRDDLLTALIVDAYDELGARVEAAVETMSADDPRGRWYVLCDTVRVWARAHPHEYALVYGSPVPGYQAPPETVAPASRVPRVMLQTLHDGWTRGWIAPPSDERYLSPTAAAQANQALATLAIDLPASLFARSMIAWTQLFGMINFELFGHLVGSFDPADEFFAHAVAELADYLGLPAATSSSPLATPRPSGP